MICILKPTQYKSTLKSNDNAIKINEHISFKIPTLHRIRTRLLLLITVAIFIIEALVYIPSVTSMRTIWLENIFSRTEVLSAMSANSSPMKILQPEATSNYLDYKGTLIITLIQNNERKEVSVYKRPPRIDQIIKLNERNNLRSIYDSLAIVFSSKQKFIQIIGSIDNDEKSIELVISSKYLRHDLLTFTYYFLLSSLAIAILAAVFIFTIVKKLLLNPFGDIYVNLLEFVKEPENPSRIMATTLRKDELGSAQRQLVAIETELQQSYVHQKHLANLGLAVAKINHDMRNILTSAQLVSDRLVDVQDPLVQKLSPKLVRAIDRATNYSQSVIAYGRAQEVPPKPQQLNLRHLIEDIKDTLLMQSSNQIEFNNLVADNFEIYADPDHLYRTIMNLSRNAMQAMLADHSANCVIKRITIRAGRIGAESIIDVEDTGPGLPTKTKEQLFSPFHNSSTSGGTGLGLAICDELVRAQGGHITLVSENSSGTHFEIRLPDRPIQLSTWRKERQTG